jgi:MbtH protein
MFDDDDGDAWDWLVVVNDEAAHALWPAANAVPPGWRAVCEPGTKQDCLRYVQTHWTDMRPLSLRAP